MLVMPNWQLYYSSPSGTHLCQLYLCPPSAVCARAYALSDLPHTLSYFLLPLFNDSYHWRRCLWKDRISTHSFSDVFFSPRPHDGSTSVFLQFVWCPLFVSGPHFYCWFFFFFGNTHIYICMLTCLCFFSLSWRHEAALARLFCNSFQMCLCSPLVKSGNPTQGLCHANTL